MPLMPDFIRAEYADCLFCGGMVEERLLPREIRWKGELLVFEDVPVGVCAQCGEKFLRPAVAKKIDAALQSKKALNWFQGATSAARSECNRVFPRQRTLWMNSKKPRYQGNFSCEIPR